MLSQVPIHQQPPASQSVEGGERERKRRRKALSCYDCRRRKLRCDRSIPSCSRCSKAGLASSCRYESGPSESRHGQEDSATDEDYENSHVRSDGVISRLMAGEPPSTSSQNRRIAHLEDRVAILEAALANQASSTPNIHHPLSPASMMNISRSTEDLDSSKGRPKEAETMIFRAESMILRKSSFKSQYYGASNINAQLVHFQELFSFAKDSSCDHTSLIQIRSGMTASKKRRKAEREDTLGKLEGELFTLLPSREEADYLLSLYCETYETTYRILHKKMFWEEYQQFWLGPKENSTAFVAILLLAMATVRCVSTKETPQYIGESTKERETASLHIAACESWLRMQGTKHLTIDSFQVHCLLILAKVTNSIKIKQAWTSTGTSLRFFMSAGLHRDPNAVHGIISEFHKEMRRRLWSTMTELELEAAITRGMPTILAGLRTDCGSPQNINDEEFGEPSQKIPTSRPFKEHTSSSFLCLSQNSFSLRVTLASLINSSNMPLPYDDVLLYEKKIVQQLRIIPRWTEDTSGAQPNSALLEALLDMQLRQFLIMLHYPFARRSGPNHQQDYSRMACFNAASSIIEQHAKFAEAKQYALMALRTDVYRAAICLCQNIYMSSLISHNPSNKILNASSLQLVEKALGMLEQNTLQFGQGYKNYVFLAAGYGIALSKATTQFPSTLRQLAIDRFVELYRKVTASQSEAFRPILISDGFQKYPPLSNGTENSSSQLSNSEAPFFAANAPFDASQGATQQFFDFDLFDWNFDFASYGMNSDMNE